MISVTIPAITKPYQNINLELILQRNSIENSVGNAEDGPQAGISKIIISSGANDTGFFQLGGDQRYFPFEGVGAISDWVIRFPENTQPDPALIESISDIIITLRYTAQDSNDMQPSRVSGFK